MRATTALRRDATRSCILEKADQLFRQFGFSKTTVSDIAGELAMSPANIYKFFPSKDAIVEASAANDMAKLKAQLLEIEGGAGSAAERIEALVVAMVRRYLDTFQNEKQFFKLIVAAVEQDWPSLRQFRTDLYGIAADIIRSGIDSGEFAPAELPATAVTFMDCLLSVTHPLLLREIASTDAVATAREQVAFLLRALR